MNKRAIGTAARRLMLAGITCLALVENAMAASGVYHGGDTLVVAEGGVELRRGGWRDFSVVDAGTLVRRGDLLRLGNAAQATVVCEALEVVVNLTPGGLEPVPCVESEARGRYAGSLVSPTRGDPSDNIPIVLAPRATKVLTPHPKLHWARLAGVDAFEVRVRGHGLDWHTSVTDTTSLVYPDTAPALQPGTPYKVIVTANGRSSDEYNERGHGFTVLDAEEAGEVQTAVDRILALDLGDKATGLLTAQLFAGRGLNAKAIETFEALPGPSPPIPALWWLGNLNLRVGLSHRAEEHYRAALGRSQESGSLEGEALAQRALGELYRAAGLATEATRASEAAIELYRTLGDNASVEQIEAQMNDEI